MKRVHVLSVLLDVPVPATTGFHLRQIATLRLVRDLGCTSSALVFTTADRPDIGDVLDGHCDRVLPAGPRVEYWSLPLTQRLRLRSSMAVRALARRPARAYPYSLPYDLADVAERVDAAVATVDASAVLLPTELAHLAPRLAARGVLVVGDAHNVLSEWSRRMLRYGIRRPWRLPGLAANVLSSREQERRCLPALREIWTTTDGERPVLERLAPDARVIVAGNAIVERAVIPSDPPIDGPIGFIGNYAYRPNLEAVRFLVMRVFPLVRSALPDARLVLAGNGMAPRMAARLAAEPGVTLLGPVEDAAAFVRSCGSIAIPIRVRGGVPLKLVEALASARPTVATPELVAGIAVEPGRDLLVADDAEGLAAALVRISRDRDEALRLSRNGRSVFEREFSFAAMTERLAAASLLAGGR
jgi:glycosyltransferase involved in cell wall biosynthesis